LIERRTMKTTTLTGTNLRALRKAIREFYSKRRKPIIEVAASHDPDDLGKYLVKMLPTRAYTQRLEHGVVPISSDDEVRQMEQIVEIGKRCGFQAEST